MRRRTCTAKQALWVAVRQGAVIPCYRCGVAFTLDDFKDRKSIEREHVVEIANGGADEPENWRWSHGRCHHRVTNGKPHTSLGSSRHSIAKGKRLRGETKQGPKAKIRNRSNWPKGQKIAQPANPWGRKKERR